MLRLLTVISFFILASDFVHAQDTLYKVNNEKVIAKIQQIGPSEIVYKRADVPDGPVYVIPTSDVSRIVYSNGKVEVVSGETDYSSIKVPYPAHRWTVAVNAFDAMFGMISVNGEFTSKKNLFSVQIPVSFGAAAMSGKQPDPIYQYPTYFYYNKNKIFSSGINLHFFPLAQKRSVNYYLGVAFEFGMVNYKSYWYGDFYPYVMPTEKTKIASYMATGFTNGILIKPADHLTVGVDITGGMMVTTVDKLSDYKPMARLGINLGYTFGK